MTIVNWYVERTIQAIITIFGVITLSFGLIRLMPGGPIQFLRAQLLQAGGGGGGVSQQRLNELTQVYLNVQPEKPLLQSYLNYMGSILTGDLGKSFWYNEPVVDILVRALPWTIFIMSLSVLLSFGIGVTLGALLAYNEGSMFDVGLSSVATFLNSIPFYVVAVLLLYFVAYGTGWFPTSGRYNLAIEPGLSLVFLDSVLYHAILPVSSFVITAFGIQALTMRGNSISVLGEDYLRVARLRGVPPNRIALRYVGRNAVLPMYTGLMISIGFLFGGSIILEQIFQYPGVGYYLFKAIKARDYALMMGGFLVITVAVVISIFIADLTYGKIDPRASRGESREIY